MAWVLVATALVAVAVPGTASAPARRRTISVHRRTAGRGRRRRAGRAAPDGAAGRLGGGDRRASPAPRPPARSTPPSRRSYRSAQAAADTAQATARQAGQDVAAARAAVASFARSSYMMGSTSARMQAVLTSAGPGQLLERAALLDAAGTGRTDVLQHLRVVQRQAADAVASAQTTVTRAATLEQQASAALASAEQAETQASVQAGAAPGEAGRHAGSAAADAGIARGPAVGSPAGRRPCRRPCRHHAGRRTDVVADAGTDLLAGAPRGRGLAAGGA